MAADDEVNRARQKERRLRERLADTIVERRKAVAEADRLAVAEHLSEPASRQRARSQQLADDIEALRAELRAQEKLVADLEADADGAPPATA
jgi:hypothetical protein